EFTRLLKGLTPQKKTKKDYRLVGDKAGVEALIGKLRDLPRFTLDLETTSADPMRAEIVGISFAWEDDRAWYVPVAHQDLEPQPDRQWLLAQLRPLLEDPAKQKIGHNLKYEYVVFKRYGITLRGMACDTMVASYVLNPSKYRHSLDNVSIDYLDHRMISFKDIAGTGKKAITFDYVPIDTAVEYACEDSDITAQLARLLEPKIQEQEAVQLFHRIEMPLVEVLATMEMNGVRIDVGFLGRLSAEFHGELSVLENKIFEIAGESFNINSPKQLGVVLFEKLGLPVLKKTKTGYSTNVETLTELAERHPLPREVLSYRSLAKLTSTYIDAMPNLVHPATGRIHTSYNQTVTATGRLSSSEPNLQNIPIRTEEGVRIREAFITEPGWKMLSADYSQVELRVLAHMCEDETLIDAFNRDEDIHARTAAEIWGGLPQEVDPRRRREAKAINFGIIYGMSSFGLGKELGISPQVAGEYIDSYFARYGRVKSFLEGIVEDARQKGYVATLLNRRRYLPDIKAKNGAVRKFAERTAVNAPIQGTAADLIKIAMINIAGRLEQENLQARMLMQVHDELVFEAPEAEIETLAALVRSEMEGVIEMKVPLRVDM
ncbi:MAG: DNA polymerase I, partial [Deltaproteobacteria bacterium]|nr:DNA polymerase I [Deltaproteobacteria bacterium]